MATARLMRDEVEIEEDEVDGIKEEADSTGKMKYAEKSGCLPYRWSSNNG